MHDQQTVETYQTSRKPLVILLLLGILAVAGYFAFHFVSQMLAQQVALAPMEADQSGQVPTFADVKEEMERRAGFATPDLPKPPEPVPSDIEWIRDGPPEPSRMDLAEGHRPKFAATSAGSPENALFREAVRSGEAKLVRKMLAGGLHSADGDGRHLPPVFDAVMSDSPEILGLLISAGADIGGSWRIGKKEVQTPLSYAVWHGKTKALFALLDAGADATRIVCPPKGPCGNALSLAALTGDTALLAEMIGHDAIGDEVINMRGIYSQHINAVHSGHRSLLPALHMAARAGHSEAAETLLALGADLDRLDVSNKPADYYAGSSRVTAIVDMFAARRADAAALAGAVARGDTALVETMLANGVNPDIALRRGPSPLVVAIRQRDPAMVKMLLEGGANPSKYHEESTPLQAAMVKPDLAIVRLLLDAGADPNEYISGKIPPLAAAVGRTDNVELVQAFLDAGVSLTARYKLRDGGIHNILSYAIHHYAMETAVLLARNGVDPNLLVCSRQQICGNALTMAAMSRDSDLVRRLILEVKLPPETVNMTHLVDPVVGLEGIVIRRGDEVIPLKPEAKRETRLRDGARLPDGRQVLSPLRAARVAGHMGILDTLIKLGVSEEGPGEIVIVK